MAKQSPHVQWKGCYLDRPHKHREQGQSARKPLPELRWLGKSTRVSRHDPGDRMDDLAPDDGTVEP
jgi:hypothetical protein